MQIVAERGYLIPAVNTANHDYESCAVRLASSLRQFHPDANITILTESMLPHGNLGGWANDWQCFDASPYLWCTAVVSSSKSNAIAVMPWQGLKTHFLATWKVRSMHIEGEAPSKFPPCDTSSRSSSKSITRFTRLSSDGNFEPARVTFLQEDFHTTEATLAEHSLCD